jgi:hypothetical protein
MHVFILAYFASLSPPPPLGTYWRVSNHRDGE